MRVRLESDGATVALEGQPLARGGEAAIHPLPDRPGLLAKVYHKPTPEQADKLAAMIANPPADPTAGRGHVSIAWPLQRLLAEDDGRCVGFAMPRVDKALSLFDVYNPKSRLQTWPLFHYGYLLRTARNLSTAVRALHAKGYVLGDLNESNVLVNAQTLVTVVDTDSFQVRDGERVFRCAVGKPEYVAPEIQSANFAEVDRTPEQDAFALAVLIFQLLMQGTHPFAGRFTGQGEPETLARRIASGHWPYARARTGPFAPNPIAPPFMVLPFPVRELMHNCFEDGHDRPSARPDASSWQRVLAEADAALVECPANVQHRFHKAMEGCPWCELAVRQGRDPFPSKDKVQARVEGSGGHKTAPPAGVTPKSKPIVSVPPPPPLPSSKPGVRPSRNKAVRRGRALAVLAYLLTPWPYLIGGGVAALGLLIHLIAANARQPGPLPIPIVKPDEDDATPEPKADHTDLSSPPKVAPLSASPRLLPISGVTLKPGGSKTVSLRVERNGYSGPITLQAAGLPYRVTAEPVVLAADQDVAHFELTAADEAPPQEQDARVRAVGGDGAVADQATFSITVLDAVKEISEIRRFEGTTPVWSVAFSPDGRRALSGGADGTARLWDVETAKSLNHFDGHSGPVWSVAFSPDGRRALSGGADGTVRLWDVETAKELRSFKGHSSLVLSVAFSPDGRRALSGGADGTVRLWDVETGKTLYGFGEHSVAVRGVAISPDGRRALSGGDDMTMRLWDLATGWELRRYRGHTDFVSNVAFSPDGRRALSGSRDRMVRLWDVETGKELHRFEGHSGYVNSVAFSPDGRRALSGGGDGTIRLWDVDSGAELYRHEGNIAVRGVAFSPDGRRALVGGDHGMFRLLHLPE